MSKLRSDLKGVVYVHTRTGSVRLAAGDEVPAGATVSADLLAAESTGRKAGNRGRKPSNDN